MIQEDTQPKKLWSAPVVTVHGSVEEITQAGPGKPPGFQDDNKCNSDPI